MRSRMADIETARMAKRPLHKKIAHLLKHFFGAREKPVRATAIERRFTGVRTVTEAPAPEIPDASRVQMVRLARIKAALGAHWPDYAQWICRFAEQIIARGLLPGDVYEEAGEDGFLVLFAQLSPEDARFKADALSHEIERQLLGSARVAFPHRSISAAPPIEIAARMPSLTTGRARILPGFALEEHDSPRMDEQPGFTLERRSRPRLVAGVEWHYRPVWDFENSALILFALLPEPSYESIVNDGAATPAAQTERRAELDVAAILKAACDLADLSRSGRKLPLIIQLDHKTIANARRRAFIRAMLHDIPRQFRQLLMLEIVGLAPADCDADLSDFISALSAMRIRASIRLEPSWLAAPAIPACGAQAVTMAFCDTWPEAAWMQLLGGLARRAKSADVDCGLWGIATRSIAVAAASSGVRYLSGRVIAGDAPNLSHALRYSPLDLYRGL